MNDDFEAKPPEKRNYLKPLQKPLFDEAEVRKALDLIIERGSVFEVRALAAQLSGNYRIGPVSGYFDDVDQCVDELSKLTIAKGIYVTFNPVNPALLARRANRLDYVSKDDTTKNHHIVRRRWLVVDVDADRPSGISATNEEKGAAHKKALEIYDYLKSRGWHSSVADSGNGFHLLYRVDLACEDDRLMEKVLDALADRSDGDGVKIDRGVHNPSRVARLYGTLAAKGDNTEERPHRMSKILLSPLLVKVTTARLQALVDELQSAKPPIVRLQPLRRKSTAQNSKPNKAQIREMLTVIPKRPDYHDWIKIVAAVGDALDGADAVEVLNEWSKEEQPGEYADKLRHRLNEVHIGTLIRLAREHGWRPQPDLWAQPAGNVSPAEISAEWQEPERLPEDMPAVPPFDYQCLPETLRPWIKDIAERMQCPPDFPAVGAMIVLGSLVGRKVGICPKRHDDWLVIPNLWGGVVGRPGLLKSPALQQALVPLRRLAVEAFEKHEAAMREHGITDMVKTQRKKLAEKKIGKHLKAGDVEAARAEAEAVVCGDEADPVCRRYEINDSTIEKLGVLLAENPTGLLLFRDELSGFLRALDREDRAGDRAKYLEMWDGKGELTYDRIGRGTVRIPSNTLSILGGIQPDVLLTYVREAVRGGTGNDGLLQRFQLFVWPDVSKVWRNVDRLPDTKAKNDAFAVFEYLDGLTAKAVGADTSDGMPFLRFANDAQELFDAWRADLEKKLRSDVEHPAFEAHLAKYRKLVPALSLLTHLANRKIGPVSLDALNRALLWARYLEAHARRIYSAVLRPDAAAARELAKHLQRGDRPERFNLREVYRKGWAGLNAKEDAEAAVEILCDFNWIRIAGDAPIRIPGAPGRAASRLFETNPKIPRHPPEATDKTDKINSVSSVSDHQGVSEKIGVAKNEDSEESDAGVVSDEVDAFVPAPGATGKEPMVL